MQRFLLLNVLFLSCLSYSLCCISHCTTEPTQYLNIYPNSFSYLPGFYVELYDDNPTYRFTYTVQSVNNDNYTIGYENGGCDFATSTCNNLGRSWYETYYQYNYSGNFAYNIDQDQLQSLFAFGYINSIVKCRNPSVKCQIQVTDLVICTC